ncbi:MAG: winged helix-turn-helix domain-containing protein [Anaerolineaceae bacterium]|jgi:hypothetical protein
MIEALLGSEFAEKVLMYLAVRGKGYASEIAAFYDTGLATIQNQLRKFEDGGVLVSFQSGRTRVFEFNPSYPFLTEIKGLLEKALIYYPPQEVERLTMHRRRPRRTGKAL